MNDKYISFEIVGVKEPTGEIYYHIVGNKKFDLNSVLGLSREDLVKKNKVFLAKFSSLKEAQDNFLRIKNEI